MRPSGPRRWKRPSTAPANCSTRRPPSDKPRTPSTAGPRWTSSKRRCKSQPATMKNGMAAADVFDALISRRPYKPPLPMDTTRQIITEGRGSHFDPDIVDAFLTRFDEFQTIAEHYADQA